MSLQTRIPSLVAATALIALGSDVSRIQVLPENPLLFGKGAQQRLTVLAHFEDGSVEDVTDRAEFRSSRPDIAEVSRSGVVRARLFGGTPIRAGYAGAEGRTVALVQRTDAELPVTFGGDVLPVLTRMGCNGGNCHGAMNGQNGFKLSLFGDHPDDDYRMVVKEHAGRRLDLADPAASLLLKKPTFQVSHGGGRVLDTASVEYRTLLRWIEQGAGKDPEKERRLTVLSVHPEQIVLHGKDVRIPLLVTARYSDGTEADFTRLAYFDAHDTRVVEVSRDGIVTSRGSGLTTVLVRGPGAVAAARVGVVTERHPVEKIESDNLVDRHIFRKLTELHIPPSPGADDATFLRRAYLDTIGLVPTSVEARQFLADSDPSKRSRLVDHLLERPEYADFWSLYWGDHLNNTKQLLYNKGPYTFTRWLYDTFRRNTPYDEFVRTLLTSTGNMYDSPATSFYPLMKKPLDLASQTSQLFLGVRIGCARCHNHPMEKWTQDDYNGMAAFFSQIRYKGGVGPRNNERTLYLEFDREFYHPENEKHYRAKALGGPHADAGEWEDRRELLADWMTDSENPFFSRAIVNRVWKQFMGRGFVEPVDDFRLTNPPSHPGLLDALARDFVEHGFDLHHLIRQITSSRAYRLSSVPTEANREDTMGYSRYGVRRLTAEQLLDSISQATGVPEEFESLYPGTRAAQLPEPEVPSYFLDVFDRPSRQLVSDRSTTNSLNQALHLASGNALDAKIGHERGILRHLLEEGMSDMEIVDELYLRTVSRYPTQQERDELEGYIERSGSRRNAAEDIFWSLLNSKEFLYQH
ncbi:MAG: DUF1549 and DUF1553 domain-containing protein [Bryobacterales bacterium]|nr:DUF1549 and DUF1553 domain-containing protein [Bryobacterales bacterium]